MDRRLIFTYTIIAINLVVFGWLAIQQGSIMMGSGGDVLAILRAGANLNPLTLGGEPWRIITSMFLHFGIIHFAVNMLGMYSMGRVLEPAVGTLRFTLVYFFCGIIAGISSLFFNVYVISAGASGALFGIYGYGLAGQIVGSRGDTKQLQAVIINFLIFVGVNAFFTGILQVDLPGHIGGFVGGFAIGMTQFKFRFLLQNWELGAAVIIATLLLMIVPKDQLEYYRIYQKVVVTERKTNQIYRDQLSDAQLRDSLITIASTWDSIKLSFSKLRRVRDELREDTSTMRRYVQVHRLETGYRISLIEKESFVYMDSLELINHKFDSLPSLKYHPNYDIAPPNEEDTIKINGPKLEPKRLFYDAAWKEIDDPSMSTFYRVGTVDSANRWQGPVRDYYKDGTVQMKGSYKDNMKNGVFLYYSDHGTYSSAGRYDKEESIGKWETYFWNGQLRSEVYYDDRTFVRNIYDSLGSQQVTNGNGIVTEWYANGQVSETGSYVSGRKDGDWFGYLNDGSAYFREVFRDNKLVKGFSQDKSGKRYVYDELSQYAYPVNGMPAFNSYVEKNKITPSIEDSGTVKVVFNVGNNGDLWDFVIVQSISPGCDKEAIRLIKEGPPWRSGLQHGHIPVPSQGYAEVNF